MRLFWLTCVLSVSFRNFRPCSLPVAVTHGQLSFMAKSTTTSITQPIARVHLKINDVNSSVFRDLVTPAELAVLVASFKSKVGDNPIVSITEQEESDNLAQLEEINTELEAVNSAISALREDVTVVREVRMQRQFDYKAEQERLQAKIDRIKSILALRRLSSSQECSRLCAKYATYRVKSIYPGGNPNLPTTFNEAIALGLNAKVAGNPLGESSHSLLNANETMAQLGS